MNVKLSPLVVGALIALGGTGATQAATLTISCGSVGQDFEFCKRHTEEWSKKTGHTVKLFTLPQSTTDLLGLYRQMFAAKSADVDIINVDVVWPGMIKDHLIDLKPYSKGVEKEHFPSIVANNTVDGKLIAMPWFTDAGLLYYRKDLLDKHGEKPPTTWEQLAATAKKIQDAERKAGNADMQGFVFQAKAYEGLTCDAVEWLTSYGGGNIVDASGKVTVNNPQAAKALTTAASWIGTIAPTGVLNYGEEDARGVFQNGNAVFMRNWPYAWSLGNGGDSKIKDKIGVSALPKGGEGGKNAATLGGWQLAVSKYSKEQKLAAELVMYLTSKDIQKERAIKGSFNPTLPALYKDKDVLAATPFFGSLYDVFTSAVPRPSTATGLKYNEVSAAFWNATHDVLSGKESADVSLKKLEGKLNQVKRGKW
ncbi:MAG TPA: ABC transporter substrate-binding protein [Burkholderiaceae bacterium]|nr:ABC transporter substrate-binding protein [Burkholderiaceae bacterium]HMX09393.1 ABC transporter substrate-binding protein [Burkholderiaceae bacterium]HMY98228.1 ABC transporter substrate-binding protein [Burkholderiaceae bacterium]HNB43011.1 ABC transporter substrate-binding protein [Burkholderiaceae bacterium]HNG78502.1 ABC transporter substrate-binding protein [Burkholderiaceae bacterium]